jgi:hypothetical protein
VGVGTPLVDGGDSGGGEEFPSKDREDGEKLLVISEVRDAACVDFLIPLGKSTPAALA